LGGSEGVSMTFQRGKNIDTIWHTRSLNVINHATQLASLMQRLSAIN